MARFARKKSRKAERRQDAQVRQSQMVGPYGAGSMIDLVHHAVVVSGLDDWYESKGTASIEEPRLRDRLERLYDLNLYSQDYFRRPPECEDSDPTLKQGIRVVEFPAWFVCQGCRRLVNRRDLRDSTRKDGRRLHECERDSFASTVPIRFVGACAGGHLDDYPWVDFVHMGGETCSSPELTLDQGRSGDFSEISVKCETCGASTMLATAMAKDLHFKCRGRSPWLPYGQQQEHCEEDLRLLVRTASNGYFAMVVSALSVPDPVNQVFDDVLHIEEAFRGLDENLVKLNLEQGEKYRPLVEKHGLGAVLKALNDFREGVRPERQPTRTAEYQQFLSAPFEQTGEDFGEDNPFVARRIEVPSAFQSQLRNVVFAHRLREVRVQYGFTRLEPASQNNQGEYDINVRRAPLSSNDNWLPATTVQGEGVFFELEPDALDEWSKRPAVQARAAMLREGFEQWYENRAFSGGNGKKKTPPFLGAKFYLIHSLSHLLINAISLECGYSASAIRERIYCGPYDDDPTEMQGILLYTGTVGSEGTLGGLVDQGRRLDRHLQHALESAELCSNDPICAAHTPVDDPSERWLEGAACHGCLFVSEPSCERFNRYLDRALVVPVIGEDPSLAFFRGV